jgi:hypothetical protein
MKGLSVFLCLLAILAAAASAGLYSLIGDERQQLEDETANLTSRLLAAERRAADLKTESERLAAELATVSGSINETRARNTTVEARNSQLSREIVQARAQLAACEQAEKAAISEVAELRRQIVDLQSRAVVPAIGSPAPSEKTAAYEARIADLEAQLGALRRISGGSSSPATPAQLAGVPADLSGRVVEVGPHAAFVVLDLGTRHGAVPALELAVRRGSLVVARVRLTDVRDSFSIAHVLPNSVSGTIRPGDSATRF